MTIIESRENKAEKSTEYLTAFYDSLGVVIWKDTFIRQNNRIYWKAFEPVTALLPKVSFNPPIQLSPISRVPGEQKTVDAVAMKKNSADTLSVIRVDYEIEAIESVTVPAGTFLECIRMRMTLNDIDIYKKFILAGTVVYWFARDVGPIKYIMPSDAGNLVKASFYKSIF